MFATDCNPLVSTIMKIDIFFLPFTIFTMDEYPNKTEHNASVFVFVRCRLFRSHSKRSLIGFRSVICQNVLDRRNLSPIVGLSRVCCLRPIIQSCLPVCGYSRFFGFNVIENRSVLIPEPPPAHLSAARTSHR